MEGGNCEFAKFTVLALKAFLKACGQNVSGNSNNLFVLERAKFYIYIKNPHIRDLLSSLPENDAKTLFPPSFITFPL